MTTPKTPPPEPTTTSDPSPYARQIETLVAALSQSNDTVQRLTALVETLTGSGARVVTMSAPVQQPLPLPEPPKDLSVVGPTLAELWTAYHSFLATKTWRHRATSIMRWSLAWFAPSVCFRREEGRREKVPVHGPDMLVRDIDPAHWEELRAELLAAKLHVTTRNLVLDRTRAMLNWAVKQKRIKAHGLVDVEREAKKPKRRTKVTDDYLDRFRPHANALAWAFAVTGADVGARPGESRLLLWRQIDTAIPILTEATEIYQFAFEPWQVKGKKKSRAAFFTRRCLDAYKALPRLKGNPYVFGSPLTPGEPYSAVHLWRLFRDTADAAGLEAAIGDGSVHAHDLRRGYASKLIKADASLVKVKELLGHEHVQTTMLYVDVEIDDLREAHSRLASAARLPAKRNDPTEE